VAGVGPNKDTVVPKKTVSAEPRAEYCQPAAIQRGDCCFAWFDATVAATEMGASRPVRPLRSYKDQLAHGPALVSYNPAPSAAAAIASLRG
jgi:hypothetical protein